MWELSVDSEASIYTRSVIYFLCAFEAPLGVTFLCLSVLISKMGIIAVPVSQGFCENRMT